MNETKKKKKFKLTGASLFGKFATIIVSADAVEVCTVPTVLLVVSLWVFATAFYLLSVFINILLLSLVMAVAGGVLGFVLVLKLYTGKREARFDFCDVVSFVSSPPDFVVNTKDSKMFSLRLMPKKQAVLIGYIKEQLDENPDYRLEKVGEYYKVRSRREGADSDTD